MCEEGQGHRSGGRELPRYCDYGEKGDLSAMICSQVPRYSSVQDICKSGISEGGVYIKQVNLNFYCLCNDNVFASFSILKYK